MTYYEELGVESSATTEEIRRAYKRLTRLMHPDHQMDPELRAAAERQMRRLNQIEEILTNPGARADYDSGLLRGSAVLRQDPVSDKQRKLVSMGWVWVMSMVAVIILFAVWFPADGERVAAGIRTHAQQEAEEIKERANREIETAKNNAISEIYEQAADLATSVAGKILRRNLNAEDQRELVRGSLEQLQTLNRA